MPNKLLFALSKKHDVPVEKLEKSWDKAKKIIIDQYGSIDGKYALLMKIFKRMTNLGESSLSFKEFNLVYSELFEFSDHEEQIFVYHGFNDIQDGVDAIVHGLSGKSSVPRLYSYEADNNPNGLFVTPDLKLAKSFGKIVIGFEAKVMELEAPVWPNGSYTSPGQASGAFGHGRTGRVARHQAMKDEHSDLQNSEHEDIKLSVAPRLQKSLFHSGEPQALFIGHLDPKRIAFISVMRNNKVTDWDEISMDEFKKEFQDVSTKNSKKIYNPEDTFSADTFYAGLTQQMKFLAPEKIDEIASRAFRSENPRQSFRSSFEKFLWPKQFYEAFKFFSKKFKKTS
jgi:hypothetical protein